MTVSRIIIKNQKFRKNEIYLKSSTPLKTYKNQIENLLAKGIKKITIFTLKNSFSKAVFLAQKLTKKFPIKIFNVKTLNNKNIVCKQNNSKIVKKTLLQIKLLFEVDEKKCF